MNIKIQKLLFILLPVIVFIYFLIPIDFIWFIFLNLLIGIIESIVFLVLKKERIRSIVSFISVFVSFFIYLILYKNLYYYYHISWNIVFFTLSLINIFNPFFYFFQNYPNKKKLIEFICIFILVLFKSFIFDTKYYYATTSSSLIQDVIYNSKILKPTNRDSNTQGNVKPNRVLIAEQNNQRLKNTDHQFVLEVKVTSVTNEKIKLLWYVNSLWDYESYKENSNNVTKLPINSEKGYILKIPDGLSQYLTVLGRAYEFYYTSMWEEEICPKK